MSATEPEDNAATDDDFKMDNDDDDEDEDSDLGFYNPTILPGKAKKKQPKTKKVKKVKKKKKKSSKKPPRALGGQQMLGAGVQSGL